MPAAVSVIVPRMKPVRLLLLGATVLLVVLVAAVVVGFNGRFQTWLVRRELAARQDLHATVDAVSVSLGRVQLRGLRVERQGAVLTVPALEVELPLLSAGLRNRVQITRLTAKGWTLDLTKAVKVGRLTGSPATRSAARSPRPP